LQGFSLCGRVGELHRKRRKTMSEIISFEDVEKRIITIREQQVLIDRDVGELYE